jgi:superfamily II DNA or RNA helicase
MFIEIREQLFLRSTNTEITNEIKSLLDKPNPDFLKMKRMGYPTEKIPPRIRMYEIDDGVVIVPRGAWRTVNEVCKKHGVQVSYEDNRTVVDEMDIEISEELTPFWYQEEAINKMIKFQQGMVVAPCLVGSTVINVNRGGNGKQYTLKKMYDSLHSDGSDLMGKNWNRKIKTYVRSFNGEAIVKHLIKDVIYSGYREVYKMTLANGRHVTGTANHKIMTDSGWTELGDCLGMYVMCDTLNPPSEHHVHHIDHNHKNNSVSNLELLPAEDHARLHSRHTKYNFSQGIPEYSECINIEYIGMQDVYDIICEEPYRNFVANGIVCHNCGAGKSVIGCAFIARLRKPTIIVVHTLELFKQWEDMVREHLNFPGKIGKIGGGTKTLGNITIAMIQTLVKLSTKEWSEIQSKFEIFIGDESHHFGAESYIKCMRNIRAKYAIGLTATPKRKDKKDFVIHNYLGNVIYEITDSDLEMMGRSLTCKCKIVETKRNYNYTKMNEIIAVLGTVIAKDKTRNEIIVEKIKEDIDDGRTVLVLIERVAHGKILYSLLKQEQIKVELISGAVDANTRSKIKSKMKTGQLEVLVANKAIAAEGLDIPIIDSVHICFWTSNISLVKQMIGRGRRPYEGKEFCRVWFYKDNVCRTEVDNNFREVLREVPTFKYSFSRLTSWLESQSFTVVNDGDPNTKELFSR